MKRKKIKVNIIKPQASSSKEDMHKLASFFDLLLSWHIKDQNENFKKEV